MIEHFYTNIKGWFDGESLDLYKLLLRETPDNGHIVEIGSFKGRSSSFMAVEIINSGKNIKFDCVDTWLGSIEHQKNQGFEDIDVVKNTLYDAFLENMRPVEGYYRPVRLSSVEAATQYEDNSLDAVFIDAAHDYNNVKADIAAWLPKVKLGGIISGDDYLGWPGVNMAVNEKFANVSTLGGCWYTRILW